MAEATNPIRIEPERQPYEYAARLVHIKRELYRIEERRGELMAEQDSLLEVLAEAMEPGQSRDLLIWATGDPIHLNLERDRRGDLFASHVLLEDAEKFTWPESPKGETFLFPAPDLSGVDEAS